MQTISESAEKKGIRHWPDAERPRERLLQGGGAGRLTDAELVAILLRSARKAQVYERALARLQIPFYSPKSRSFFEKKISELSDNTRVDLFGATLGVPSALTVPIKHCCVAIISFIS